MEIPFPREDACQRFDQVHENRGLEDKREERGLALDVRFRREDKEEELEEWEGEWRQEQREEERGGMREGQNRN
jgi:hypothetical protein